MGTNGNASIYGGLGIHNDNGKTGVGAVVDLKGSYKYGSLFDGDVTFGASARLRGNFNTNSQSVQLRAQPLNVDIKITDNVSMYASPYGALKLNCENGNINPSAGLFVGLSQQITDNLSLKEEAQLYDLSDISNKDKFGVNLGLVWEF